jgi:hypothetical protein
MVAFRSPVDIGNRAAQHCGVPRMDPTLGFADTGSRAAGEISFCYSKMIEAELQRRTWTFATRRQMLRAIDTTTMRIVPSLWSQLTTYFHGSIVADQFGNFWISRIPNNLNNDPLLTTYWEPYFGPLTADPYDTSGSTAYFAGELVYTYSGAGTALVYQSQINANADVPGTATVYDPTVTYFKNQVVTFSSVAYMSLIDLNLNNEPDLAPVLWAVGTTYAAAAKVGGSDGNIYQSVGSGNIGHDPTTDGGAHWTNTGVLNPWTTVFVGGHGSLNWLLIGGTGSPSGVALAILDIIYPIGSGPSSQSSTSNAFRMPAGFLRQCPQNPKPGIGSLGGPTGIGYNDWLVEGDYIVSADSGTIFLRFVTNFTDVARMHTQFCEAVAVRIAFAICNSVTQSKALIELIVKTFKEWENDAMIIDGIEDDFADPPDDDYLTVRA